MLMMLMITRTASVPRGVDMFPADESVRVEEHPGGEDDGAAAVGVVAHDGVAQPVAVHPAMWHAVRA